MKENTPTSVLDPQPVGWASILRAGKHRTEKNGLEQMEAEEHASMTLLHFCRLCSSKAFCTYLQSDSFWVRLYGKFSQHYVRETL